MLPNAKYYASKSHHDNYLQAAPSGYKTSFGGCEVLHVYGQQLSQGDKMAWKRERGGGGAEVGGGTYLREGLQVA